MTIPYMSGLAGKLAVVSSLACLLVMNTAQASSLQQGINEYNQGNFTKAVSILLPLSKDGDAEAQNHMGLMLANGKGIERNDRKAVYWFKKAAKTGHQKARQNLAFMRANGRGVKGNSSGVTEEYDDCED